jgi:hypothetical protein
MFTYINHKRGCQKYSIPYGPARKA